MASADGGGTGAQAGLLGAVDRQWQLRQHPVPTHHARQRQTDLSYVVELGADAHRKHRPLVAGDAAHDAGGGEPYGEVGGALPGDDLLGGIANSMDDGIQVAGGDPPSIWTGDLEERHTTHRGGRPQHDLGVAVLADDRCMDAVDPDAEPLGEQVAEAGGVEHGPAADDPLVRQPGDLLGDERHHVDRIGDQQHDRLRSHTQQRGECLPDQVHVATGQLHAGLARVLLGPGGHHHDVGAGTHLDIVAAGDTPSPDELQAMPQVEDLGPGLGTVDVVESDLVGDPVDHRGVGDGGADAARADDGDLPQPGHQRPNRRSRWVNSRNARRKSTWRNAGQ